MGLKKCAIRIDSGDIAYLTKKARAYLDAQGLTDCKIIVSNALDEYLISERKRRKDNKSGIQEDIQTVLQ